MSETKNWSAMVREHGAIFLLLLFFGVLYATTLRAHGMFIWDEAEYASLGRSVLRGEGFSISGRPSSFRLPLVPLSAAASMALFNSTNDIIVRLPGLFFSLLTLFLVYWCVKTQLDRLTGLVAATLLGIFPAFWRATPFLLTEIPFMAFFTGAVLFFSLGLYRERRFFHWSWLCFSLALLTRYNAILLGPIIVVFLLLAFLLRDTEVWGRVWSKNFFIGPLAGLALFIPWLIRQQLTSGSALSGFMGAVGQVRRFQRRSMSWASYPVHLPEMISWIPVVLLLLGIFWAIKKRDRFALHCLLAAVTLFFCFGLLGVKVPRLTTSVLPFLAILAALGLTKQPLLQRLHKPQFYGIVSIVLSVVFAINFFETRRGFTQSVALGYPSFLRALQFLREKTSPDAMLVGASYPQIFWYTERRVVRFPDEARLKTVLEKSEWVIVNNFERMQQDYVQELLKRVNRNDIQDGNVVVFRDRRFSTIVIRSSLLKQRLEGEGQPPGAQP